LPDGDQPDPVSPTTPTVPALVDDYRRQQEAWRLHALELSRLKAEALTAAEHEAATIVTNARAEIRRIIVTARRELHGLAAQIKTLSDAQVEWPARQGPVSGLAETTQPEPTAGSVALPAENSIRVAQRLLDVRHSLLDVLEEARPDLEHLRDDALIVRAQPPAIGRPPTDLHEDTRPVTEERVVAARPPFADVDDRWRPTSAAKVVAVVLVLLGLAVLLGAVWGNRSAQAVVGRHSQVVQAPTRPAAVSPSLEPVVGQPGSPRPSDSSGPMASSEPREGSAHLAPSVGRAETSLPVAKASLPVAKTSPSAPATPPLVAAAADLRRATGVPTPPAGTTTEGGAELTSAAMRWLDAYYRHDAERMASVGARDLKISDQRAPGERPSPGLGNVSRTLEQVKFQFVGDGAILTGRLIEQIDTADQPRRYLSWISQVWLREAGAWRLMEVRIISDANPK
jgi:hypothetical protein